MSSLQAYHSSLDYAYAPGMFPAMECLLKRPEAVRRVLISSKAGDTAGVMQLKRLCSELNIRVEEADRALARISQKENCFAAAVFQKTEGELHADAPHVVLVSPGDQGNVGTILRTCLGVGLKNIALIRPCVDVFDPKVIRASMGAMFAMEVKTYDDFDAYFGAFQNRAIYPFMLDGAVYLNDVMIRRPYTLVFGNEGSGLPKAFAQLGQAVRIPHSEEIDSLNLSVAVAIGAYHFTNRG